MAIAERTGDRSVSQSLKALLALRELVLRGELRPGERVSELQMVERLGVSRTPSGPRSSGSRRRGFWMPSRPAASPSRRSRSGGSARGDRNQGHPRGFGGALGCRARRRPVGPRSGATCLDALDEVVRHDTVEVDISRYVELNAQFHALLIDLTGSPALARQIERASALPFASPSALVPVQSRSPESHHILTVAQDQHRSVLIAIERREGSRAEAIMREHARIAHRNLERAFANQRDMDLVPGSALIKRRIRA